MKKTGSRKKPSPQKASTKMTPAMRPQVVITQKALAGACGVSARMVRRWIETKKLPCIRTATGRVKGLDLYAAITWLFDQRAVAVNDDTSSSERLRLVSEQADEKALANAETRCDLIRKDHVSEFGMAASAGLAITLNGIPGRLANELAAEDNPALCRELVKVELMRARSEFSEKLKLMAKRPASARDQVLEEQSENQ